MEELRFRCRAQYLTVTPSVPGLVTLGKIIVVSAHVESQLAVLSYLSYCELQLIHQERGYTRSFGFPGRVVKHVPHEYNANRKDVEIFHAGARM